MEMKLLISSALFLLVVALTEGSPTNLERRSFLKGVIRNTQRRPLNKIKKNKNNFLVRKTPVPQRPSSYRGGEPPHTNAYERPQYPTEEEDKQFSPSQLYKLFGIRSAVAGAQQLFDKAIEEIQEINEPLEQIESLMDEAEEELDQFEPHCIGVDLYAAGELSPEIIGNKCYTYENEKKNFVQASVDCLARGGSLAEPDVSPESDWGYQIIAAFGITGDDDTRLNGLYLDPSTMNFEQSGFKLSNKNEFWLDNNQGASSSNPTLASGHSLTLSPVIYENNWYLDFKDDSDDLTYLCEYHLIYSKASDDSEA